ncbi:MAG: excinuclease ABC subunit UvrC, partial [bacterium]|nr:excinuclease ABC subunit UvrC [bacterium]
MNTDLKETIKLLPDSPGVYLFKDKTGKVIYVGKAKNLKKRVRSYFRENLDSIKTEFLVKRISSLEYIITISEREAFILENILIQKHQPKYNIDLKDDKSYPYIKINLKEEFPRLTITRKPGKKQPFIRLFGPYPAMVAKDVVRYLEDIYKLKRCSKTIDKIKRPCFYLNIGKCIGMCTGKISSSEYKENIEEVIRILKGNSTEVLSDLRGKMNRLSEELKFEEAAELRDRINNIKFIQTKQLMLTPGNDDYDIVNYHQKENIFSIDIFSFRQGKLWTKKNYIYENKVNFPFNLLLHELLSRFYQIEFNTIPPIIYSPEEPSDKKEL